MTEHCFPFRSLQLSTIFSLYQTPNLSIHAKQGNFFFIYLRIFFVSDGQTIKKPIKCSAPKYIDYLMTWVQDQLDDEALFPSKIGKCHKKICLVFLFFRKSLLYNFFNSLSPFILIFLARSSHI